MGLLSWYACLLLSYSIILLLTVQVLVRMAISLHDFNGCGGWLPSNSTAMHYSSFYWISTMRLLLLLFISCYTEYSYWYQKTKTKTAIEILAIGGRSDWLDNDDVLCVLCVPLHLSMVCFDFVFFFALYWTKLYFGSTKSIYFVVSWVAQARSWRAFWAATTTTLRQLAVRSK